MKTFTDRVNAVLPVGEPDPILYALVHNQLSKSAARPVPPDNQQSMTAAACLRGFSLKRRANSQPPPRGLRNPAKSLMGGRRRAPWQCRQPWDPWIHRRSVDEWHLRVQRRSKQGQRQQRYPRLGTGRDRRRLTLTGRLSRASYRRRAAVQLGRGPCSPLVEAQINRALKTFRPLVGYSPDFVHGPRLRRSGLRSGSTHPYANLGARTTRSAPLLGEWRGWAAC
jgi:hypothetical protein